MTYREMLKWAKETMGLAIKGQPKKEELEKLISQVEAERRTTNDPAELRAGAQTLKEIIAQMEATAHAAEERAGAIEGALAGVRRESVILYSSLAGFQAAVSRLTGLGLPFEWPSPLTAGLLEDLITTMLPPVPPTPHTYEFELDGEEYAGRAVVSAFSFSEAKAKALAGDIIEGDRPEMEPDDFVELQKAMEGLTENGTVERIGHTLTSRTLA